MKTTTLSLRSTFSTTLLAALTQLATLNLQRADAQTPTADDFNPGAHNTVYSLAVQTDGKILVGGYFTTLGGQSRNRIGRLNADGTLDSTFNPGANYEVYALAVQADGKILVGGRFMTLGGPTRNRIGRLNANGTLDGPFNPGASSAVYSLALQADGKILVGGEFTTLGGQPRSCIGRLNADGTLDNTFNTGTGGGGYPYVYSLALQADGKILVGGSFTTLGGQTRNRIGRLNADGTLDSTFDPGANGYVYSLAVQPDGKILVGGGFTTLGGQPRNRIARLNADGTLDSTFDPGAGEGSNPYVYSLAVQADGKILVGGLFTTLGGQPRNRIGRLNTDGSLDSTFDPGASSAVYSLAVQADGKILVGGYFTTLGGQTRNYIGRLNNTEPATQSLAYDGSTVIWLRGGTSPEVWRTTCDATTNGADWFWLGAGERIAGSWQLDGVDVPAQATLRTRGYVTGGEYNGSAWFVEAYAGFPLITVQPVSRTNAAGTTATVSALAVGSEPLDYQWQKEGVSLVDGGNIFGAQTGVLMLSNVLGADMGGYAVVVSNAYGSVTSAVAVLTVVDPVIMGQPARLSREIGDNADFGVSAAGTPPLAYQWRKDGTNLVGATVSTLALTNVQTADAGLYVVVVSSIYGSVTSTVAELSVNGATLDGNFDPGANNKVYSLAVQADGRILVGGSFTNLAGQTRDRIGRLNPDGTLDSTFNPGAGGESYPYVYSLTAQADEKILLGGAFSTLGGQARKYIGRLNADGTLDSTFNPGAGSYVYSFAVQPDRKILLGGLFTTLGGQPCVRIGRLNPEGTLDSTFNPGAGGVTFPSVYSVTVQADGKILVGGEFTTLSGQPRDRIGRLNTDGTLDSTFNPGANSSVLSLAVQANGKILVGGGFTTLGGQPCDRIGRLNADGTPDSTFNPGANNTVLSLAVQADGKIVVAGGFTTLGGQPRNCIGRLNADGTLDSTFNPEANASVLSLAVQADGKILVGGEFTTLGGQPRDYIARLNNTEPVTQSLAYDGSTITWLRGGASPEVWRTTFDATTNGVDWFWLGAGERIAGGWQVDGVDLPAQATLRTRGYVTGGRYNGSAWFVETYADMLTILNLPELHNARSGDGTLTLTWPASYTGFVLEFTESLTPPVNWQEITDGISENGGIKSYTVMPDPTGPTRLYRLRLQLVGF